MMPVHMNPEESVRAWQQMASTHADIHRVPAPPMLGVHWGTYRLTDEPLDEPPLLARAIWEREGFAAELLWTPAHGETRHFAIQRRSVTPVEPAQVP